MRRWYVSCIAGLIVTLAILAALATGICLALTVTTGVLKVLAIIALAYAGTGLLWTLAWTISIALEFRRWSKHGHS